MAPPSISQNGGNGKTQIMPMAELEKQAILSTIAQLNGDKLLAAANVGHREDHALPQAEGVCHAGLEVQIHE